VLFGPGPAAVISKTARGAAGAALWALVPADLSPDCDGATGWRALHCGRTASAVLPQLAQCSDVCMLRWYKPITGWHYSKLEWLSLITMVCCVLWNTQAGGCTAANFAVWHRTVLTHDRPQLPNPMLSDITADCQQYGIYSTECSTAMCRRVSRRTEKTGTAQPARVSARAGPDLLQ